MTQHNNLQRSDFEIMAPAGSWESLAAAFQAGADSIYFGIEKLNMRSKSSSNFTINDMHTIVRSCQEHGVKSYLTVNTVMYEGDLELMHQIVDAAKEANVTAIIAADVAVLIYAREKGVEVHLSVQLNIANIDALKFYAQYADVVVLARELNLDQVAEIHRQVVSQDIRGPKGEWVRIEMFCHGALCMAVSGKCYLSLHEYNHSANRGACVQICRRGYNVKDKETDVEMDIDNQYILSPKDLKTIHFLNKLMDAGVRVFKIEGRARGAEYVKTVVSCYNEAIHAQLAGAFSSEKIAEWDERLSTVFNRGFWDGYYLGQRLGEWTNQYGSSATKRKVLIGKGIKYYSKLGVAEFLLESNSLSVGDEILITGPTSGAIEAVAEEIRVNMEPVTKALKGQHISIPLKEKIRPSDKLYKVVPAEKRELT
jgi:U32 family peptidase